jgi:hypothetical protein
MEQCFSLGLCIGATNLSAYLTEVYMKLSLSLFIAKNKTYPNVTKSFYTISNKLIIYIESKNTPLKTNLTADSYGKLLSKEEN